MTRFAHNPVNIELTSTAFPTLLYKMLVWTTALISNLNDSDNGVLQ
jgi:hypothetical protein